MHTIRTFFTLALLMAFSSRLQAESSCDEWLAALAAVKEKLVGMDAEQRMNASRTLWRKLEHDYPVYMDWLLQDGFEAGLWEQVNAYGQTNAQTQQALLGQCLADLLVSLDSGFWRGMLFRVVNPMMKASPKLPDVLVQWMFRSDTQPIPEMAALYIQACEFRREQRLAPMLEKEWDGIVFAQHFNMGASHYAYTEGLIDAQRERHFYPGAKITLLRFEGTLGIPETLLEDKNGVIRDVDISWDGERILFAWKKSDFADDYSLYEMNLDTREIRAITSGLGHADYEAVYAPNGDILFNSTRCVQIVDCWWTEVSNLYTCAADGRFLRRLAFDQVHDNYPTITEDGRVLYTRWDYNDRGQIYPQGLFEMLPDGTAQQAFYGNNSWFPTTILHARSIPGTGKVVAIFTGHHSWQAGKLATLDTSLGREENSGAQLIAPVRETPAERIDAYGQDGDLFKYPYPFDDTHFLVSYTPMGWETRGAPHQMHRPEFGLYLMDAQGNRELLYRDKDSNLSVGRMVPVTARPVPAQRPESVDYAKATGTYYIQDIHAGPGLEGIPRGAVKKLRVVALEYRAAGIGNNTNGGVAGGALISTPIAIGNGSWDVKVPLGDATIYEDGSAMFEVPARMPVYFQALDEKGRAVQSMRSWSTLQPGETQSCVGCHENKNTTPLVEASPTLAMRSGAYPLEEAYGTPSGFSFCERIQPILDQHCVKCHYGEHDKPEASSEEKHAFSLMDVPVLDEQSKRYWNEAYVKLTEGGPEEGPVRWISSQSAPPMLAPGTVGALTSPLIAMLEKGHNGVQLSDEEMRMLSCWIDLAVPFCGDYTEANAWTEEEKAVYARFMEKRRTMETLEAQNIEAYLQER
jgi:cytochrome c553